MKGKILPFQSKNQMKAAFAGGLGPEMQGKADAWAKETPDIKDLPIHKSKGKPPAKKGKSKGFAALEALKKSGPAFAK